jgi:hypothetical protein
MIALSEHPLFAVRIEAVCFQVLIGQVWSRSSFAGFDWAGEWAGVE